MSKDVFTNKEQLCQSFWQSVKEQKFKAKKIEGGFNLTPPLPLKASRVKGRSNNWGNENIFAPLVPIYNDFASSIFVPIQIYFALLDKN